jgi:hypothetical protein
LRDKRKGRGEWGRWDLATALMTQTMSMAEMAIIKVRFTTESTTLNLDGGVFEFKDSFVSLPVYTTRQIALSKRDVTGGTT